jgi:hypothetical protein
MNTQQNATKTVNEKQLREGIMPRAQLSKAACEIAVKKTTQPSVKQRFRLSIRTPNPFF